MGQSGLQQRDRRRTVRGGLGVCKGLGLRVGHAAALQVAQHARRRGQHGLAACLLLCCVAPLLHGVLGCRLQHSVVHGPLSAAPSTRRRARATPAALPVATGPVAPDGGNVFSSFFLPLDPARLTPDHAHVVPAQWPIFSLRCVRVLVHPHVALRCAPLVTQPGFAALLPVRAPLLPCPCTFQDASHAIIYINL